MGDSVFGDNLFVVDGVEDIPVDDFKRAMEKSTFACIRGVVAEEEIRDALAKIEDRFDPALDHAARGHSSDAVRTNFQKLNVGGETSSGGNDDARFFRVFYNPIFAPDVYGMRSAFVRLAQVRNRIAGLAHDFALDRIEENGLWTASRIHQYPRGGGFFRRHTDYVVKDVADEKSTEFFQLVLTLSQKGEHFSEGGSFVDLGGERICLDEGARLGDIVVYDGRTVHGVEDIDPTRTVDLGSINGRLSGFATLYKML